MYDRFDMRDKIHLTYPYLGNSIGDEGARALAESLKQNTTITDLILTGMSEMRV